MAGFLSHLQINVTVNDSEISTQELPGDNLVPVSLTLQSSIADLQCAKYQPEKALYELNVSKGN